MQIFLTRNSVKTASVIDMDGIRLILILSIFVWSSCQQKDKAYPLVDVPVENADFYQAGLAEVTATVKSNPGNPDGYFKQAIYLQKLGRTEEALASIKQAINLDPDPDYLMKEAELLTATGDYKNALARISRAQILGGDYPDLWHLMAKLNYLEGNYDLALTEITLAIKKYPEGLPYYCTKGKIEWSLQDTTAALNSFQKSLDHPETEYESLTYLARLYQAMGDNDKSFEMIRRSLDKYPNDYNTLLEQGKLLVKTANYDSALAVFHHVLELDSVDIEPLYELAKLHFNRRWYDSTIYYTNESLRIDSTHLPSLLTQARVYDRRTYYGTSMKKYQEILAIDSTYQPAVEELAKLKGKVAYLQKIRKDREANTQVETISPTKPPINN